MGTFLILNERKVYILLTDYNKQHIQHITKEEETTLENKMKEFLELIKYLNSKIDKTSFEGEEGFGSVSKLDYGDRSRLASSLTYFKKSKFNYKLWLKFKKQFIKSTIKMGIPTYDQFFMNKRNMNEIIIDINKIEKVENDLKSVLSKEYHNKFGTLNLTDVIYNFDYKYREDETENKKYIEICYQRIYGKEFSDIGDIVRSPLYKYQFMAYVRQQGYYIGEFVSQDELELIKAIDGSENFNAQKMIDVLYDLKEYYPQEDIKATVKYEVFNFTYLMLENLEKEDRINKMDEASKIFLI